MRKYFESRMFSRIFVERILNILPISTRMSNQSGPQLWPAVCIVEAVKQSFLAELLMQG